MKKYDIAITGIIGGTITADNVRTVLAQSGGKPVSISVCSLGGWVHEGLAMYQAIRDHGNVSVTFVGMSASAATFLAMGAKEVRMAKHALILIHNSSIGANVYGEFNKEQLASVATSLTAEARRLATIDDIIAQAYADRHGFPVDGIKKAMTEAAWLKPIDAIALGIVDSIDEEEKLPTAVAFATNMLAKAGLPSLPTDATETTTSYINPQTKNAMTPKITTTDPEEQKPETEQPTQPDDPDQSEKADDPENPSMLADLEAKLKEAQETIATLQEQLTEAEEQVRQLQAAPPTDPGEPILPEPAGDSLGMRISNLLDF